MKAPYMKYQAHNTKTGNSVGKLELEGSRVLLLLLSTFSKLGSNKE